MYTAMMQEYYVWLFSRYIGSNGKQLVPGQGGFISATGSPPPRKSTVDYSTQPITDNSVVRDARTSKSCNARRILRKDQQRCHSALYLLEDATPEDLSYPKDALFFQDGMALLHVLTNLPPTCGEICLRILDQMVAKKHFIFSTDSYHSGSIKAQERLRRDSSDRIILSGPATRKPFDFKIFLANDDHKKQLCQLLLRVWGDRVAASRLQQTEMAILIVEGKAYQLIASNGEVSRQPSFII